jgi:hypothetical protein
MATTGCGINHKDTKHTDKCRNNKTTKPQINTFFFFQNFAKITSKKVRHKVYTYYTRSIQQTVWEGGTFAYIMSVVVSEECHA